jgi:16S rRNA (cytosine1402-N4)-methyltransferase
MHEPVMVSEVLEHLAPARGGLFVDCTVGLGGHARALLLGGASRLIGLDRDPAAIRHAGERLSEFGDRVDLAHSDYRRLGPVLDQRGITGVDGLLADLGVSSMQLDAEGRGFSFRRDEPLDMRMDTSSGPTAAEALADVDERTLADVIYEFGEERHARRVARSVIEARTAAPIDSTARLADIVRRAIPRKGFTRIDPATRTFQAIRIWVNRELDGLDAFLVAASERLNPG